MLQCSVTIPFLCYRFQMIWPFYIWNFVENGQGMVWLNWHICSSFVDGLTHNSCSPNRTAHHLCWVHFIHARTSLVRSFTYYHISLIRLYVQNDQHICPPCSTWCTQCKQRLDFKVILWSIILALHCHTLFRVLLRSEHSIYIHS